MLFELIRVESTTALAVKVASLLLDKIEESNGIPYSVAFSGGRIANNLFSEFAARGQHLQASLKNAHYFWADERCVAPNDPESNYRVTEELLLKPLAVPANRIHRIRGELEPTDAAKLADDDFAQFRKENSQDRSGLDLILLGMGEDGHVASLFPGSMANDLKKEDDFHPVFDSPKAPAERVTLSYRAVSEAREVWVLVSGAGKEAILRRSLEIKGSTPLARVIADRERTIVFTDLERSPETD